MFERTIYVNVATGRVSSAADGTGTVALCVRLRTLLTLHVVLVNAEGEVQEPTLASGESGGMRLAVKAPGEWSGAALLQATGAAKSGSGSSTKWSFLLAMDSVALLARIDQGTPDPTTLDTRLEIQWLVDGESAPRLSAKIPVTIDTAVNRSTDTAPDLTDDAMWATFKARIVAGAGVTLTVDDDAKTITVKAGYTTASGLYLEHYDKDGALVGKSPRVSDA